MAVDSVDNFFRIYLPTAALYYCRYRFAVAIHRNKVYTHFIDIRRKRFEHIDNDFL